MGKSYLQDTIHTLYGCVHLYTNRKQFLQAWKGKGEQWGKNILYMNDNSDRCYCTGATQYIPLKTQHLHASYFLETLIAS